MKRLCIAAFMLAAAAFAGDEPVAQTIREDGSTNTWTAAELQAALGLMNRMYWRDMATDAGRRRWHGERLLPSIIITNEMMRIARVDVYADGFIYTNAPHRAARPVDPEEAAKRREEAERKAEEARRAWEAANLPPEYAALRAAQRAAQKTNEVTVVIEGN